MTGRRIMTEGATEGVITSNKACRCVGVDERLGGGLAVFVSEGKVVRKLWMNE